MASKRIKYKVVCGKRTTSKHATMKAANRKVKKGGSGCRIEKV